MHGRHRFYSSTQGYGNKWIYCCFMWDHEIYIELFDIWRENKLKKKTGFATVCRVYGPGGRQQFK